MIVFSGRSLVAHWTEGKSDYLLVTFNQLDNGDSAADGFFMQPQVEAAQISCIGIMTREKNFFLSPDMEEIAAIVAEARAGRSVVVFGQSMGGYAALKFSALLRADVVVAASPFYSVRVDELELLDEVQRRILVSAMNWHRVKDRPEFSGMAIREADTHGRLIVLCDTMQPVDVYGARLIVKAVPRTELIAMPHVGHVIYDTGWSTRMVIDLLDAARSADPAAIRRTTTALRRGELVFVMRTLLGSSKRKPRLCAAAMSAARVRAILDYRGVMNDPFNLRAIFLMSERGDHSHANKHLSLVLRTCSDMEIRPATWADATTALDMLARHRCLVLSMYGAFLCWNTDHAAARFEPHPFGRPGCMPIVASLRGGEAQFDAIEPGRERPVPLFATEAKAQPDGKEADAGTVQFEPVGNTQVAIRRGQTFFGTEPHGGALFETSITKQHRLVLLPLSQGSDLFKTAEASVFDQLRKNITTIEIAAQPISKPRWRALFNRR